MHVCILERCDLDYEGDNGAILVLRADARTKHGRGAKQRLCQRNAFVTDLTDMYTHGGWALVVGASHNIDLALER